MPMIEVKGLSGLLSALNSVGKVLPDVGDKILTELSYRAEYEAKLRVPVRTGRLFASIGGNVSLSRLPVPSSPEANPQQQDYGKNAAIWTKVNSGGETEITMGTSVIDPVEGTFYPPIVEFVRVNSIAGYHPQLHWLEDGANAAVNSYEFEDRLSELLSFAWTKPSYRGLFSSISGVGGGLGIPLGGEL